MPNALSQYRAIRPQPVNLDPTRAEEAWTKAQFAQEQIDALAREFRLSRLDLRDLKRDVGEALSLSAEALSMGQALEVSIGDLQPPSAPSLPVPGALSPIGHRYPAGPTDFAVLRADLEALDVTAGNAMPKSGGQFTGNVGFGVAPTHKIDVFDTQVGLDFRSAANPGSGLRGLHLNRTAGDSTAPHGISIDVGGVAVWDFGLDFDLTGGGSQSSYMETDWILANSHLDNGAGGVIGDVFRLSHRHPTTGGGCKFIFGTGIGSPHAQGIAGCIQAAKGVGGLEVRSDANAGTIYMTQRGITTPASHRTNIVWHNTWQLGNDSGQSGIRDWWLYDNVASAFRLFVDSNGAVSIGDNAPKGRLTIPVAPTATGAYGLVSLGTGFGGAGAPDWNSGVNGTFLAMNATAGYLGNFCDLQVAGVSKFSIDPNGAVVSKGTHNVTVTSGDAATYTVGTNAGITLNQSSGSSKRVAVKLNNLFQIGTDTGQNNTQDLWVFNNTSGQFILQASQTDTITLANTNGTAGVRINGLFGVNVAPITAPAVGAAATDAATTQALANAIRTALIARGIVIN
jgi:hypothetical protein